MKFDFLKNADHQNLDGKELFKLLLEVGSFGKLSLHLEGKGIIDVKTGERFYRKVLQKAVWRWVLNNEEESFNLIKKVDPNVTWEFWEQFLVRKAYTILVTYNRNRKKFDAWILENGHEKYLNYKRAKYHRDS